MNWIQKLISKYCYNCKLQKQVNELTAVLSPRDPNQKDNRAIGSYWINTYKNHLWICISGSNKNDAEWFNVSMAYPQLQKEKE